jgi:hypothetical protein
MLDNSVGVFAICLKVQGLRVNLQQTCSRAVADDCLSYL